MTTDQVPASPMAQCSITGKIVPEDELVTIQGQRVCAEGKAILLERLKSGEAAPGELERPTVTRRFACILVDGLILTAPFLIAQTMAASAHASTAMIGLVALITSAVQTVYFGQLHGTRGQSVGKMAGKIRVVNMDGTPINLRTGYIRALAYVGPGMLNALVTMSGAAAIIPIATMVVGGWSLADALFALFDRGLQRSLHDRIAGTRVVVNQ